MQMKGMLAMSLAAVLVALPLAAQQPPAGAIEFVARATPTAGRPEPVMKLSFSLLRKSYADIGKEAEQSVPKPDLDKFIGSLEVSKELKAWMKRTRSVSLSGSDFSQRLTAVDVLEVPEFFEAYLARNAGDVTVGFPASKAKDKDRVENPQRYEKAQQDYRDQIRKFIASNPHTVTGIEVQLTAIDPGQRWLQQDSERKRRIRDRALELAETSYLVAKSETDLQGRGSFAGIPPGNYWLSSIEGEGVAGDVRLRWDTPVPVGAGRITRVTLSNVNAVRNDR